MRIRSNSNKPPGAAPPPGVQTAPPPQVKRPRPAAWPFILFALFGMAGWWVWDSFVRTSARAVVQVDQIEISSPLTGLIDSLRVTEDGDYEAGTIAFTVVDRDSRDELETLELRLRLIESRMVERNLDLKLDRADRLYQRDALIAERRAELGKAGVERAQLAAKIVKLSAELPVAKSDLVRIEKLVSGGAAGGQELIVARAAYQSVTNELDELIPARVAADARVDALTAAVERPVPPTPQIAVGVEPLRREAELVRRRIEQLQATLLQAQVRLSARGTVVRILRRPGEFVKIGDSVLLVTSPGTLRVVAYFDQSDIPTLRLNEEVRIRSSYAPDSIGRIARLGPNLRVVPEPIARFSPRGQPLFPVEIEVYGSDRRRLVPGSIVRVFPLEPPAAPRQAKAR